MVCVRCNNVIPRQDAWPDSGLDMGLHVRLHGGYGEFADSLEGAYDYVLCHSCGHDLVEFLNDSDTGFHFPFDECPDEWSRRVSG